MTGFDDSAFLIDHEFKPGPAVFEWERDVCSHMSPSVLRPGEQVPCNIERERHVRFRVAK